MGCDDVAKSESLRRLRANQLVARNAGACAEAVVALQNGLATTNARDGVAILFARGDVRRAALQGRRYALPRAGDKGNRLFRWQGDAYERKVSRPADAKACRGEARPGR